MKLKSDAKFPQYWTVTVYGTDLDSNPDPVYYDKASLLSIAFQ